MLCHNDESKNLKALVDSGVKDNLIDSELAASLHIPVETLSPTLIARALNGTFLAEIRQQTISVTLVVSGNHSKLIQFCVLPSSDPRLVLGHSWLSMHNPHINWSILGWSEFCLSSCLHSALPPVSSQPPMPVQPPDLSLVPAVYHDLAGVFDKDRAVSLPLHCLYDCAIGLLPGAPLPSGHLYNLSCPEREAMQAYVTQVIRH